MLIEGPQKEYRTWALDSRRWADYRPRLDDIVVATFPKCGTTWTQRVLSLLVFQTPEPQPVMHISPWIDCRFKEPIEVSLARIEAQEHRRFLKSHLPLTALPLYGEVKYIHVARDGRDACMSMHNHLSGYTEEALALFDKIGLEDDAIGRPYPRVPSDPADFFHTWVAGGAPQTSHFDFFDFELSWWDARQRPNILLVHYNDLKADLSGEMQRIAEFLDIRVAPEIWPELVSAASFDAMQRDGPTLVSAVTFLFDTGSQRFFHKGTNERWRGLFREEDLAAYDAKIEARFPPECALWVARGRLEAGDPRLM